MKTFRLTPQTFFFPSPSLIQELEDGHNSSREPNLIFREVDDRDLVLHARKGRVEAFNVLVSRWETRIFNYLLRFTGVREDAMDLSQESFLKAHQNLARLDDPSRFGPWLYRIAHNEAISHIRRQRPGASIESIDVPPDSSPRMAPIEVSLAVESALKRLTDEQREAVVLKVYEGFKFEEIAQILDCPPSTVKSRVYTAFELLKDLLAPVTRGAGGKN
jgi:RNA polymerase sigma-70 factor (ECF subfamily)